MARYFLHVRNGNGLTRDIEGAEYPDLKSARDQAVEGVRSILSEEVRNGILDLNGTVEITEGDGTIVLRLAFVDAVEIRHAAAS